jgi:hypothetical protein
MNWHMLTLTSQPDGSSGYRMYVDGQLAAQMNNNQTYIGRATSFFAHSNALNFSQVSVCKVWKGVMGV